MSLLFTLVPGGVTSLEVIPDIVSVVVTWEPPTDGRGSITQYELSYGLSNSENFINSVHLSRSTTSYRVTGLAPSTAYMFVVTPSTSAGVGPQQRVVSTTRPIGEGCVILCCVKTYLITLCSYGLHR